MGRKKSQTTSKISSSSALAASSTSLTAHKSSILHSRFLPSRFQTPLFASVIQGLGSQHLRFHDTRTARLQCEHAIQSKASVTCLDWGYYGKLHRDQDLEVSRKKRKRGDSVNGKSSNVAAEDVVLAFGTSDSEINMFSPARAKVVGVLKGAHTQGIRDFKFTDGGRGQEGWSIGGEGKLIQWNLLKGTSIRSLVIPGPNATSLYPLTSALICASHNAYLVDLASGQSTSYKASINPVHTIVPSSSDSSHSFSFLTAAESDHYLTVFDGMSEVSSGILRTEDVAVSLDFYSKKGDGVANGQDLMQRPEEVLMAVHKDGSLEIFPSPFTFSSTAIGTESETLKSRMKQRTRKGSALINIVRPDKTRTHVPLLDASFQENNIVMAWTEGGVNLVFDRIPWRDEASGSLLIAGKTEIFKEKVGASIGAVVMNGVKDMGRSHVDQSHAIVTNGGDARGEELGIIGHAEVIDISSDDSNSEFEEGVAEERIGRGLDSDIEMEDARTKDDDDSTSNQLRGSPQARDKAIEAIEIGDSEEPHDTEQPSFGELLRQNAPGPVDVSAAFAVPQEQAVAPAGETRLGLPSGISLGTVLTQSLRTNDLNLLETCFLVKDLSIVRATIERLESYLATMLLQRLAERLHSRPGRAGSLMVWIQWTLIAHGGYLASQPELMKKLASLYHVVKERANSLQPLLSLKGKLDMLEAQMTLRKTMQAQARSGFASDEDNEGVIYVEGQEEPSSEAEATDRSPGKPGKSDSDELGSDEDSDGEDPENEDEEDDEEDDDDDDDEMPTTEPTTANGVDVDSDALDSGEDDNLIDDEASSTDQDSGDDASDLIDDDSINSTLSSAEEDSSPPRKRVSKGKLSNGIPSSLKI